MTVAKKWAPNIRQRQIIEVMKKSPNGMSPSEIGEACGQPKGTEASKWVYHSVKSLMQKGIVEKKAAAKYLLNQKVVDAIVAPDNQEKGA